ncbi:MAG: hypothetical protein ACD_60C00041G0004 [uncultured bacterium]|nr:MAG: hypothetical protein ACD_60C00041G0004 [uncultured bacterium]
MADARSSEESKQPSTTIDEETNFVRIPFDTETSQSWLDVLSDSQISTTIVQLMTMKRIACYTLNENGELIRAYQYSDDAREAKEAQEEKPQLLAPNKDYSFVIPPVSKGEKPKFIIVENSHLFGLLDEKHAENLKNRIQKFLPRGENNEIRYRLSKKDQPIIAKIRLEIIAYIKENAASFFVHAAGTIRRTAENKIILTDSSGGFHAKNFLAGLYEAIKKALYATGIEIIKNAKIIFFGKSAEEPISAPAKMDEEKRIPRTTSKDDIDVERLKKSPSKEGIESRAAPTLTLFPLKRTKGSKASSLAISNVSDNSGDSIQDRESVQSATQGSDEKEKQGTPPPPPPKPK